MTIPVPPVVRDSCNAVPAKRKTPSGGAATATPPARTAPRMTAANRAHGANVPRRQSAGRKRLLFQAVQPRGLPQAAKLHQATKLPPASARPSTKPGPAPSAARAGCKSAAARAASFGAARIIRPASTARTMPTACRNRMRNLHFENGKDMETSDKPHIQYLVQHGHIAGDVFPVYVVNDRETAIKKAKSLMLDIAESFRNGRLKKLGFVQDGYYFFWSESSRQEPGENFVSILVIRDGIITGQDHLSIGEPG